MFAMLNTEENRSKKPFSENISLMLETHLTKRHCSAFLQWSNKEFQKNCDERRF